MLLSHNTSFVLCVCVCVLDHKLLLMFLINFFTIIYADFVCAICVL